MSNVPLRDYLQKYMSKGDPKITKKRKIRLKKSKLKIHDDDEIVAPAFQDDLFPQSEEEDPQIVQIAENLPACPPTASWKSLEDGSDLFTPINPPTEIEQIEQVEETVQKKRRFGDDDISPVRRVKEEVNEDAPTRVVFRDRTTLKKRDQDAERAKSAAQKEREGELTDKHNLWRLGLKQLDDRLRENKADRKEVRKPLARSIEDADLNAELKKRMFEEDPMLKFVAVKEEESKAVVGQRCENRYGIFAGVRWDGVDRSNGYERRFLQNMADKEAIRSVAYRIRTDDM